MVGEVIITKVKGYKADLLDNKPFKIHVEGTVTGCDCDQILLEFISPDAGWCKKFDSDPKADVRDDNTWEIDVVDLLGFLCGCDNIITISAQCMKDNLVVHESDCKPATWTEVLVCEEEICPTIDDFSYENKDCKSKKRTVEFTININYDDSEPIEDSIEKIEWYFGDPTGLITVPDEDEGLILTNPLTISVEFEAVCTEKIEANVFILLYPKNTECPNDDKNKGFEIEGCKAECPEIKEITYALRGCSSHNTEREIHFDADVVPAATKYVWEYYRINGAETLIGSRTLTSEPGHNRIFDAPGKYKVKLTVKGPCDCESSAEKVINITCENGDNGDKPTNGPPKNGKPCIALKSLCCFLIYSFLASFITGWVFAYFDMWWPYAGASFIAAGGFFSAWLPICCWKCIRKKGWKCCPPIQWQFLAHQIVFVIFGSLAARGIAGSEIAWWIIIVSGLAWGFYLSRAKCSIPIVLDPTTWPPCRCKKKK